MVLALTLVFVVGSGLLLDHYAYVNSPGGARPRIQAVESCERTRTLRVDATRLHYPQCWVASTYKESTMMTTVVDFLSNQAMHRPCVTRGSGVATTTSCGFPITSLHRGGALIMIVEGGMPGWNLSNEVGRRLDVDHHLARESVTKGPFRSLNATDEVSVFIDAGVPDNYYELTGLFRAPGVARDLHRFSEMLDSMKIH